MRILKPDLSAAIIDRENRMYPELLIKRLGEDAPDKLWVIGNPELLTLSKTALFCSGRCPGDAIIAAYDQAQQWRKEGRFVISGFHSAIEKECLNILLRGQQPIIICPARSIENMRIPGVASRKGSHENNLSLNGMVEEFFESSPDIVLG
jgi:predicted Rossmann fold nucleotide-binding protein DprA/Smf involved in DNA uptake